MAYQNQKHPILVCLSQANSVEKIAHILQGLNYTTEQIIEVTNDTDVLYQAIEENEHFEGIFLESSLFDTLPEPLLAELSKGHYGPLMILAPDGCQTLKDWKARGVAVMMQDQISDDHMAFAIDQVFQAYRLNRELLSVKSRLKDVTENFADWVWEIDSNLILTHTTGKRQQLGNRCKLNKEFTRCFMPEERAALQTALLEITEAHQSFSDWEFWGYDKQGLKVCWSLSGVPLTNEQGQLVGYRGSARDVTMEKATQEQIYYMANNDPLTGLFNRGRFMDELAQTIRQLKRYGRQGGIALLDIDRFKFLNDSYGHDVGDKILIQIAEALSHEVRASDIIARLGGDEFAVIMSEVSAEDLVRRSHELLKAIQNLEIEFEGRTLNLSASLGLVTFPGQGHTPAELMSKADIAMYEAKSKGRNRLHLFDEHDSDGTELSSRMGMIDFVLKALEEDRVKLFFQPIVSLKDQFKIARYEVLMRIEDEEGQIHLPMPFIQAAEDFGLISRIDKFMTTKAIQTAQQEYAKGKPLSLSINLSGVTFDDEEALEHISLCLKESGLPAGTITFEITETAALRDLSRAQRLIRELKAYGANFALDDFGVGYSTFTYIKNLDFDYLKIDGSFIRNLAENDDDKIFVKALSEVAQSMHIKTVAEMVEGDDVIQYLQEIGVDFAQGYHFGRPSATYS